MHSAMSEPPDAEPQECAVRECVAEAIARRSANVRVVIDPRVPALIPHPPRALREALEDLLDRVPETGAVPPALVVYEQDDPARCVLRLEFAGTPVGCTFPAAEPLPCEKSVRPDLAILVAEDNPINQHLARECLGRLGCTCDIVRDGAEAVAAARARKYDVIFMDVHMPNLDGLQATRAIRELPGTHRPFIAALTAYAMPGDRARCLASGMDDYVTKPCRLENLEAILRKASGD